ncbi:hypothetical protein [Bifidobacterium leontopitheci]|uniref:Uncharacterized protein n=1 Tax=Bifidobacterium leontopitheci TaxID=2650774 RepID=A0A6I1GWA8_9BIFI|nr:hypothetical protein [Bifidobacterium leontopitheci]KAB7790751.1 hypothetical protein F7D09_0667 [Bifidobacterium leontopitheci]
MPWWVWLLLALFMLAMIVIGIAYALLHGYRALKTLGDIGERVGRPLAALSEVSSGGSDEPEPPLFTQPLEVAASRYEATQAEKMRRSAAKRERHAQRWAAWSRFNQ